MFQPLKVFPYSHRSPSEARPAAAVVFFVCCFLFVKKAPLFLFEPSDYGLSRSTSNLSGRLHDQNSVRFTLKNITYFIFRCPSKVRPKFMLALT